MKLEAAHQAGRGARLRQARRYGALLGRPAGCRQRARPPVLPQVRTPKEKRRCHELPCPLFTGHQTSHPARLSPAVAVGSCIQRLAAPVSSQHARQFEHHARVRR